MLLERDIKESRTIVKPNAQWQVIDERTATVELIKCGLSFRYFVETFVYIRDKVAKSWIPFDLWSAQRQAADLFESEHRIVILKARQLGLSWLAQAYAVWHMIFDPIAEILIFSKTLDESKDFLERMRGIYDRLPEWMKAKKVTVDQKTEWTLSNESRAQALATTKGDSYAATLIIFDEADHTQDFGAMYGRAEPSVGDSGKIFVISTANKDKPESLFKKMFLAASERLSEYFDLFISWNAHPGRDSAWLTKTQNNYFNLYGSLDEFHGHYPSKPSDALRARTLNKFFAPKWISRAEDDSRPLYWVGRDDFAPPPPDVPNVTGLIIYETPLPDKDYIIGVDTAEGGEHSNDSALHVLETYTLIEVAHFSGLIDPTQLGRLVSNLALYYNGALTLIERNNHGHTTIAEVQRLGTTNLALGLDRKVGWLTNIVGKPRMYDWAYDAFRDRACVVRTQKTVIQLQSIERSTLKAPESMSDDCAVSFVLTIACFAWREYSSGWGGLVSDF